MLLNLSNFDPITFLNINATTLSADELAQTRQRLNTKIGEYVLLKLSDQLTEVELQQVTQIKDGTLMLNMLRNMLPGVDSQILNEVENFKREYLEVIKKGS